MSTVAKAKINEVDLTNGGNFLKARIVSMIATSTTSDSASQLQLISRATTRIEREGAIPIAVMASKISALETADFRRLTAAIVHTSLAEVCGGLLLNCTPRLASI